MPSDANLSSAGTPPEAPVDVPRTPTSPAGAEDIMRVERAATPDGRPLLYFTFTPAHVAAQGPQGDGGAAGGRDHPLARCR